MFVYAAALLCAIGIPAGIIYGRGLLSNKITSVDDITDTINIPVVAELPYQKIDDYIAIKGGNTNVVSEQLRALRIKLFHLHNGKETGRVTLLTSSVPGEGKSFVSINLGTALAFAYKKTVILELDMRRPKIAKSLDVSNQHKGISEYLYGKASKEEIIQRSPTVENLDVITCGAMINNPSESLEKEELKDLILWLRNNYDDVIIDSPPIHLVPDAAILSRLSDITLYLVRQGVTEKDELNFIQQLDEQAQLHNINIIFNGIERMKYGYGYRYNEGYYTNTKRTFLEPVFSDFKNRF
ncbi:polysaccharide biosynthesis tyrosine autokinase [bacterium]|nr:MAG: polysaccharide biosynthesis tyrosine autokinase [bacterium]